MSHAGRNDHLTAQISLRPGVYARSQHDPAEGVIFEWHRMRSATPAWTDGSLTDQRARARREGSRELSLRRSR